MQWPGPRSDQIPQGLALQTAVPPGTGGGYDGSSSWTETASRPSTMLPPLPQRTAGITPASDELLVTSHSHIHSNIGGHFGAGSSYGGADFADVDWNAVALPPSTDGILAGGTSTSGGSDSGFTSLRGFGSDGKGDNWFASGVRGEFSGSAPCDLDTALGSRPSRLSSSGSLSGVDGELASYVGDVDHEGMSWFAAAARGELSGPGVGGAASGELVCPLSGVSSRGDSFGGGNAGRKTRAGEGGPAAMSSASGQSSSSRLSKRIYAPPHAAALAPAFPSVPAATLLGQTSNSTLPPLNGLNPQTDNDFAPEGCVNGTSGPRTCLLPPPRPISAGRQILGLDCGKSNSGGGSSSCGRSVGGIGIGGSNGAIGQISCNSSSSSSSGACLFGRAPSRVADGQKGCVDGNACGKGETKRTGVCGASGGAWSTGHGGMPGGGFKWTIGRDEICPSVMVTAPAPSSPRPFPPQVPTALAHVARNGSSQNAVTDRRPVVTIDANANSKEATSPESKSAIASRTNDRIDLVDSLSDDVLAIKDISRGRLPYRVIVGILCIVAFLVLFGVGLTAVLLHEGPFVISQGAFDNAVVVQRASLIQAEVLEQAMHNAVGSFRKLNSTGSSDSSSPMFTWRRVEIIYSRLASDVTDAALDSRLMVEAQKIENTLSQLSMWKFLCEQVPLAKQRLCKMGNTAFRILLGSRREPSVESRNRGVFSDIVFDGQGDTAALPLKEFERFVRTELPASVSGSWKQTFRPGVETSFRLLRSTYVFYLPVEVAHQHWTPFLNEELEPAILKIEKVRQVALAKWEEWARADSRVSVPRPLDMNVFIRGDGWRSREFEKLYSINLLVLCLFVPPSACGVTLLSTGRLFLSLAAATLATLAPVVANFLVATAFGDALVFWSGGTPGLAVGQPDVDRSTGGCGIDPDAPEFDFDKVKKGDWPDTPKERTESAVTPSNGISLLVLASSLAIAATCAELAVVVARVWEEKMLVLPRCIVIVVDLFRYVDGIQRHRLGEQERQRRQVQRDTLQQLLRCQAEATGRRRHMHEMLSSRSHRPWSVALTSPTSQSLGAVSAAASGSPCTSDASAILSKRMPSSPSIAPFAGGPSLRSTKQSECSNCGAKFGGGKYCGKCGSKEDADVCQDSTDIFRSSSDLTIDVGALEETEKSNDDSREKERIPYELALAFVIVIHEVSGPPLITGVLLLCLARACGDVPMVVEFAVHAAVGQLITVGFGSVFFLAALDFGDYFSDICESFRPLHLLREVMPRRLVPVEFRAKLAREAFTQTCLVRCANAMDKCQYLVLPLLVGWAIVSVLIIVAVASGPLVYSADPPDLFSLNDRLYDAPLLVKLLDTRETAMEILEGYPRGARQCAVDAPDMENCTWSFCKIQAQHSEDQCSCLTSAALPSGGGPCEAAARLWYSESDATVMQSFFRDVFFSWLENQTGVTLGTHRGAFSQPVQSKRGLFVEMEEWNSGINHTYSQMSGGVPKHNSSGEAPLFEDACLRALCFCGRHSCKLPAQNYEWNTSLFDWRSYARRLHDADSVSAGAFALATSSTSEVSTVSESRFGAGNVAKRGFRLGQTLPPETERVWAMHPLLQRHLLVTAEMSETFEVYAVWGLLFQQRPPSKMGMLGAPFDPAFDIEDPWTQREIVSFCDGIAPDLEIVKSRCWVSRFRQWLLARNELFPVARPHFYSRLAAYSTEIKAGWLDGEKEDVAWIDSAGSLGATFARFEVIRPEGSERRIELVEAWKRYASLRQCMAHTVASKPSVIAPMLLENEPLEALHDAAVRTVCTFAVVLTLTTMFLSCCSPSLVLAVLISLGICVCYVALLAHLQPVGALQLLSFVIFVAYLTTPILRVATQYALCWSEGPDTGQEAKFGNQDRLPVDLLDSAASSLGTHFASPSGCAVRRNITTVGGLTSQGSKQDSGCSHVYRVGPIWLRALQSVLTNVFGLIVVGIVLYFGGMFGLSGFSQIGVAFIGAGSLAVPAAVGLLPALMLVIRCPLKVSFCPSLGDIQRFLESSLGASDETAAQATDDEHAIHGSKDAFGDAEDVGHEDWPQLLALDLQGATAIPPFHVVTACQSRLNARG